MVIVDPVLTMDGVENGSYNKSEHDINLESNDRNADKEGNRYVINIKRNGAYIYTTTVFDDGKHTIQSDMFKKDGAYVVKARTIDPAGNESDEETLSFVKDSTPPVVTFDRITGGSKNENGWYNRPIRFHFDAYDETSGIDVVDCKIKVNP